MDREAALSELRNQTGIGLLKLSYPPRLLRDDITTRVLDVETQNRIGTADVSAQLFTQARTWLGQYDWLLSRQRIPKHGDPGQYVYHLYVAPMIYVRLDVGFHATRRAVFNSILSGGLLPNSPERQTTAERHDCIGNIYLCERLGEPADAGQTGSCSVHWWRHELSRKTRFGDRDWIILRVELAGLPKHRLYQDIWSESGLILDGIEVVPSALISVAYP